ncbi:hypothetical protein WJX73_006452 [Symbiochloris irregularis]|uniref:Uncharacterized protein n=1 Tax=Symbiochloris irregularis TaxID=706552 RepID=A0AAW1PRC7_9CHLO
MDASTEVQLDIRRQVEETGTQFEELNDWIGRQRRTDAELKAAEQANSRHRQDSRPVSERSTPKAQAGTAPAESTAAPPQKTQAAQSNGVPRESSQIQYPFRIDNLIVDPKQGGHDALKHMSDEDLIRATHTHRTNAAQFAPVRAASQCHSKDPAKEAEQVKDQANKLFAQGKYAQAVDMYSRSLELHATHIVYVNRAIALHKLEKRMSSCCRKDPWAILRKLQLVTLMEQACI